MLGKVLAGVVVAVVLGAALLGLGIWIGRTGALSSSGWLGMMGSYGPGSGYVPGGATTAKPLSVDDAKQAVQAYLQRVGNPSLIIDEIMIFQNNAYVGIKDKQTGSGAFELLVDPATKAVFLEYGPAMMWNTEYGMMGGRGAGMMGGYSGRGQGGMMGGWRGGPQGYGGATEAVSAEQALKIAQAYLDQYQPGVKVGDKADPYPGYYTIETLTNGKILGMLSVNAYSGQVWVHTWHGTFIEAAEVGG